MSTFSGLNTALTSLYAQRRGLEVTGQNVANVNTDGYTRQRADLQSIGPNAVPAVHSIGRGVGGGVSVDTIMRIRDMFLEGRAHAEHANQSRLAAEADALGMVEKAFGEPGDTGLQSMFSDFWAGWEDIANQPDDDGARAQMIQRAETLATGLRTARLSLDQQWHAVRENTDTLVAEINTAAGAIADLNAAIQRATHAGLPSNELADKRDVLVMELADKVGATTRAGDDGILNVYVGGAQLVHGTTAEQVKLVGGNNPDDLVANPPKIVWARDNYTVQAGGTAGGNLTALTSTTKGIPAYRARLDQVAADLATTVNTAHQGGYDMDGQPGIALFTSGPTTGPITAANITLATTDARKVAASAVPSPPPPAEPVKDGSQADKIAQLRLDKNGPDYAYRRMIVDLGVQVQSTKRNLEIQEVIATQVDASREATAGVNLDEEMTNMIAYQHAYEAAGRLMSAIDETLDVLINRTGVVGR